MHIIQQLYPNWVEYDAENNPKYGFKNEEEFSEIPFIIKLKKLDNFVKFSKLREYLYVHYNEDGIVKRFAVGRIYSDPETIGFISNLTF